MMAFISYLLVRFPYSAINFHAYETTSSALRAYFSKNSTSISNSGGFQGTANSGAEATIRFMSGALAGGVATVACYPLDLVRTRLTTQARALESREFPVFSFFFP